MFPITIIITIILFVNNYMLIINMFIIMCINVLLYVY